MLTPAGTIGRGDYLRIGLGLMALKYAVDAVLIYFKAGVVWTPIDYFLSLANLQGAKAAAFPPLLAMTLLVWTVPFIWIGVMLSVRRARDAGLPPWLVVLFFVPGANYVLMATLAAWPPDPRRSTIVTVVRPIAPSAHWPALFAGVCAGVSAGILLIIIGTLGLRTYGLGIFVLTPFAVGAVAAYVHRRVNPAAERPVAVLMWTIGTIWASIMLMAIEGFLCTLMAAPLVVPLIFVGGYVGHHLAGDRMRDATIGLFLALVCGGQVVDAAMTPAPAREVLTAIEIAAPPDRVWQHVVSFADITAPPAWYFRAGLSYPLRARIEGRGVGAVRYCEFTTGAFREPITAWEEPTRLAFDVTDQPAPLREWSPYRNLYAPHLEGFFKTTRGEFRLVPLAGGRTRLEGRTWYSLRMQPQGYWTSVADAILHRIHLRVLEHIQRASER